MKKIKSKTVRDYVMNDMVWKVDLPSFLKEIAECSKSIPYAMTFKILAQVLVGNYYSLAQVKEFKSWKGFVENMPIDGWLYVDYLFSKEGGNQ